MDMQESHETHTSDAPNTNAQAASPRRSLMDVDSSVMRMPEHLLQQEREEVAARERKMRIHRMLFIGGAIIVILVCLVLLVLL
ncbi:hypothetical protein [Bifidobacterium gallicum]|uniref:Uncharacterized protein n=1 Tax=Bifidobacterium gallicum DSM 20093 = LMG 11596 TaxID=561180 RepID=D1NV64_9BIFI|nr:hypothetical protein [Bifidobacterium gallicum]EFA22715.1 hypothetical protein BIFGAL_03747 [Bifidobacterium gallicum DSM 20093 = LMG 11596]KFI59666.1 hypothetical protein BGLCM_0335 [Bifidobacterium gallicum DSM 20093 = LMG 11596]